jgi:hypothetical protein
MTLLAIAALLFAAVTVVLYFISYGLVVLFERLQQNYRRRRALLPLTRRLHDLLEEAGHEPVSRYGGGRHRLAPTKNSRRRAGRH